MLESQTATCNSMKLEHFLTPYTKLNLKWFKDLNMIHEIGKTFLTINCSNISLYQSPKAKEIQTKINKWDLIKLKSFCTAKETINKMSRQPTEWEKIFTNDVTDKGFISKIHKQLIQLNNKNNNKKPNQKMGRRPK